MALVLLLLAEPSLATVIEPEYDLWIRQSSPSTVFEGDAMWVADKVDSNSTANRWGVAEWNLTGLPLITSARMDFNPRTPADAGFIQSAYKIPDGIAGITWNGYQATKLAGEIQLSGLGTISLPGGAGSGSYVSGASATASDLNLLNSLRTGNGRFAVSFKAVQRAAEWDDGSNLGGPGYQADLPIRLIINEGTPPPSGPSGLWRVDFDDEAGLAPFVGNEPMAAAASSRFNSTTGFWSNPAVPHHVGGGGGITGFSRTILDSNGGSPITWVHTTGDPLRANNPNSPDSMNGDFWFFAKSGSVDWEIRGLVPGAKYEMFHYGGWPGTVDDERITIGLDTNGDGAVDSSQVAGLATGGPHGVYFPSIVSDTQGVIHGRWLGVAAAPNWADTAGFQLALVSVPEPSAIVLCCSGLLACLFAVWQSKRS